MNSPFSKLIFTECFPASQVFYLPSILTGSRSSPL